MLNQEEYFSDSVRHAEGGTVVLVRSTDWKIAAPSVVLFEKYLLAASSLVLIFFKKVGFSFAKFGKVTDSVQHSH